MTTTTTITEEMIERARKQRIRAELSKLISTYGYDCVITVVREEFGDEDNASQFETEREYERYKLSMGY